MAGMTRLSSLVRRQATCFGCYADAATPANRLDAHVAKIECVLSPDVGRKDTLRATDRLLVGDCGASGLESLLSLVRSLLVDLLQNGLGGSLDQILGFLQTKAGE